jgi:hypothetical protein
MKVESEVATVTVNSALSVSILPTDAVVDTLQSRSFTSTVSGGTSPYKYQWYLNGVAVSGATSASWTFAPSSAGSYTLYVKVTDDVGILATSNTTAVTVNPALTATASPSPVVLDVGQSQAFTSFVSGGTSAYSYQWYLDGSPVSTATSASWMYTPSSSGSHTVYVVITDAVSFVAASNTIPVTVNAAPLVGITPNFVTLDVGQSQVFTSIVSNGTSPYLYQWYLNGVAVSSATIPTWTFAPASTGSYTVYLNVTDGVSTIVISNNAIVTVNKVPLVTISPSSATLNIRQSQLLTSNLTGGSSPYSYQWYLNGAPIWGAIYSTLNFSQPAGSYAVNLNATDGTSVTAKSNVASFTVIVIFAVAITVHAPSKTIVGQGYSLNTTVSVANKGDLTEVFNVTLYANTTAIATQTFSLASGNSTTITFTWNTEGFAHGSYAISANVTLATGGENNWTNSSGYEPIKVTIPGDINGDGTVNGLDLAILAANWLQNVPQANPNADINGDGIVNGLDLAIMAQYWLQSVP